MREFIKACGSTFVFLGALVCIGGVILTGMAMMNGYVGAFDLVPLLGSALAGASIVLIGGSTYIVCIIDERLERLAPKKEPVIGHDAHINPMRL